MKTFLFIQYIEPINISQNFITMKIKNKKFHSNKHYFITLRNLMKYKRRNSKEIKVILNNLNDFMISTLFFVIKFLFKN